MIPPDPASTLLDEAKKIVTGERRAAYGTPEDNFGAIADLWNIHIGRRFGSANVANLTATDVAVMMVLMKCARLAESPAHHDSAVDIAGYAACLARCQAKAAAHARLDGLLGSCNIDGFDRESAHDTTGPQSQAPA